MTKPTKVERTALPGDRPDASADGVAPGTDVPTLPTYSWEPTTEFLAAAYGLPREAIVRFDVNTSPVPPDLADVLTGPFFPALSEYPPSDYRSLVDAAAASYGVGTDELLPTAGADEALDLTARAYLHEGSTAIVATPTYAMYRIVTEQRGARVVGVPRRGPSQGFALDVAALAAAVVAENAALVWVCEPNNPTGSYEPPERIAALLAAVESASRAARRTPPVVVVDEAYSEFVGQSVLGLRFDYPTLVVIRTLSKAHALAGARVGFAVARPETLAPIVSFRAPASVGTVSAALAETAFRRPELAAANVVRIGEQRTRLERELSAIGWSPYPSRTNFILIRFSSTAAAATAAETLLRAGLVPRTFDGDHPFADCLRLTVRSDVENSRLLEVARGIRS